MCQKFYFLKHILLLFHQMTKSLHLLLRNLFQNLTLPKLHSPHSQMQQEFHLPQLLRIFFQLWARYLTLKDLELSLCHPHIQQVLFCSPSLLHQSYLLTLLLVMLLFPQLFNLFIGHFRWSIIWNFLINLCRFLIIFNFFFR